MHRAQSVHNTRADNRGDVYITYSFLMLALTFILQRES